ncbi:hypothetical protein N657DRAFT_428990 [Parathielavia appendiculata]|uniref:Uncharacterized protein n=1 Tax=Parathielavia appendiculata TaxID=2587402 RepID=A0AAN6Z324_9PEZI|nr:hypothetical protein N657DRAFT_428990 [Parathielavia appendiculata]
MLAACNRKLSFPIGCFVHATKVVQHSKLAQQTGKVVVMCGVLRFHFWAESCVAQQRDQGVLEGRLFLFTHLSQSRKPVTIALHPEKPEGLLKHYKLNSAIGAALVDPHLTFLLCTIIGCPDRAAARLWSAFTAIAIPLIPHSFSNATSLDPVCDHQGCFATAQPARCFGCCSDLNHFYPATLCGCSSGSQQSRQEIEATTKPTKDTPSTSRTKGPL